MQTLPVTEDQCRRPVRFVLMLAAGAACAAMAYLVYRGLSLIGDVERRAVHNAEAIAALQRRLGIDVERAVQTSMLGEGPIGDALTVYYSLGYWPLIIGAIAVLAWKDRSQLRLLRNALATTGAFGLLVITVLPVAPPRLLGTADDHVARAPLLQSIAHPSVVFNAYAAMPSFHVAWTLLAVLALRPLFARDRWLLAAPALMVIAVITTGNHWVLDVVAGAGLALVGWRSAEPLQRAIERAGHDRRSRERAASSAVTVVGIARRARLEGAAPRSRRR